MVGYGVNGAGVTGRGHPGVIGFAQNQGDVGVVGFGNGSGDGVQGVAGATGSAGVRGVVPGNIGSNADGVVGEAAGSGSGVVGFGGPAGGTGVVGAGGGQSPSPPGNGIRGLTSDSRGAGVIAENTAGGTALQVIGMARFSGSGVLTVPAGSSKVTKTGVPLTTASLVLATLQQNVAGVYVQAAVPNVSGSSFSIHLNKAVSANITVGWFIVN